MKRTLMIHGVMLAALFPGSTLATVALFDEGHGQRHPMSSSPYYASAWNLLITAGHDLRVLNDPITPDALAGVDVLVTGTIEAHYAPSEIDAMRAFVTAGGTLLVTHDGGGAADAYLTTVNEFLAPYGMALEATSSHASGLYVADFHEHCITSGITALQLDYVRMLATIAGPAQDLTVGSNEMLAIYDAPSGGAVIAIPDDNQWADPVLESDAYLTDYDNAAFLLNIFDCARGSSPMEDVSWGEIKALYR